MTLSKKNIDKLKSISNNTFSKQKKKSFSSSKQHSSDNPNDIFHSIIDNSNHINETSLVNKRLKESEEKHFNNIEEKFNSEYIKNEKNSSIKLTEEDLLYDEFNYLLEE
tara:strand:+ start:17931 stop:18257 length:327 start_codon:yes stop_codon:yes gene_type:complete